MMERRTGETYRFGYFRLEAQDRLLYRGDEVLPITPKAIDTLLVLVRNPGRLLTKDELLQKVWPDSFVEENSLTQNIWTLRRALGQTAEQVFIETVPKRGYRFVSEVFKEEPLASQPIQGPPKLESRSKATLLAFASMVGVILVVGYFILRTPPASKVTRRSVAIIPFKNLSSEPNAAWMSTALSEMFSIELSAGSRLRLVSNDSVAHLQAEMSLSPADSLTKDHLARIHDSLKCDLLLSGTYLRMGGQIRVDMRLQDAASGDLLASLSRTDSEAKLFSTVSTLGAQLRDRLGMAPPSPGQVENIRASMPQNPEAERLYAEGLARLREFDAPAAEPLFTRAVAADPRFPLSHSALSNAWSLLGYDEKAKSEAKLAFDLSGHLSREDGLVVEARYRQAVSEWPKAIELYRALRSFFPDDLEYGLLLAAAQTRAGEGKQALQVVESLRDAPSAAGDPRIDLAEASASEALADYRRGLAAARRALATAQARRARLLEATARLEEGICLLSLTQQNEARAAFEKAREICSSLSDQRCVAAALNREGSLARAQGDLDHATELFHQALSIETRTGDRRAAAQSLINLGYVLREQMDLGGAQALFEKSLAVYRETGDRRSATVALIGIGNVLNNSGHPVEARQRYGEALQLARETGDRNQISIAMGNLAILDYTEGDLGGARKQLEEVLNLKREIGDRSSYAYSLIHLGNVLLFQGDIAGARKAWREQCQIQSAAGEKIVLANCRLALARLDMYDGRPEVVEPIARDVAANFTTLNPAADAWKLLADASLRRGDLKTAQEAVANATRLVAASPNQADYRIPIGIMAARVAGASGRTREAVGALNDLLDQAKQLHLAQSQLSARLALCQIQRNRTQILALEQDARRMGYGLIASAAKRLM